MAWCRKNIKIHYTSRTLNFETGAMSSFGKLHPSSSQGCFFFHGSMVKFAKSSHLCRENALENGSNKPFLRFPRNFQPWNLDSHFLREVEVEVEIQDLWWSVDDHPGSHRPSHKSSRSMTARHDRHVSMGWIRKKKSSRMLRKDNLFLET